MALALTGGGAGAWEGATTGPRPAVSDDVSGSDTGDAEGDLSILLDAVAPAVAAPGEDLRLTGRIVNHSSSTARLTTLTATISPVSLTSRADVAAWLAGDPIRQTSTVLGDDTIGPVVPVDGAVPFDLAVPDSVTETLPGAPSVLALTLTAGADDDDRGDPDGIDGGAQQVELRTVLTSAGTSSVAEPLDVSLLVPLTLPPDADLLSPDPVLHAAAWTEAVGPDSAVATWLQGPSIPGVTYLIDPALLVAHRPTPGIATPAAGESETEDEGEETQDEGDGIPATAEPTTPESDAATATVPAPTPDTATGTSSPPSTPTSEEPSAPEEPEVPDAQDVEDQLQLLRRELGRLDPAQLWWLPTDDPDLELLLERTPPTSLATDLLARPPAGAPAEVTALLATGRRDAAWPVSMSTSPEQLVDLSAVYAAREDGVDLGVVLLPRESFTADTATGPRRGAIPLADPAGVDALGVDSWTSALVAASADRADEGGAGAATQELMGHLAGTYLEAPGAERELVVAPPRGTTLPPEVLAQLSRGMTEASWMAPVTAEDLLDRAEGTDPLEATDNGPQAEVLGPLLGLLEPGPSPVSSSRATSLVRLDDSLTSLSEVLRDTGPLQSWQPVLSSLWSSRWRADEPGWADTWRGLRADVQGATDGVHVTPSTVNFLADQGAIQVTVVNDLAVAVDDVVLELEASNGRLQVTEQPDPVSIGPGSRASVSFEARSITRGETTLTARIRTPDGTLLGTEAPVQVRVQPTGVWIYWVLGALAGVVLVLGLVRALRRSPNPAASPTSTHDGAT